MDTENDDRAQQEAVAAAASTALQAHLWTVLNDPAAGWARAPHCAAHGVASVFTQVLVALAVTDANDVTFCLRLIDQVQQAFVTHAGIATPAATTH